MTEQERILLALWNEQRDFEAWTRLLARRSKWLMQQIGIEVDRDAR